VERASARWSLLVRRADRHRCQRCGEDELSLAILGSWLDAHHIRGKKAHPALRYVVENGVSLCRRPDGGCHGWAHEHPVLFRAWLLSVRPSAAALWQAA
jgi:predicted restriction endonuclease